MSIRVVIADDADLVILGARAALESDPDCCVVGSARCTDELLMTLAASSPDVVLLSEWIHNLDILSVVETVRQRHPQARLVVMGGLADGLLIRDLFAAGVSGYLYKSDDLCALLPAAVHTVMRGRLYLSPTANTRIIPPPVHSPTPTPQPRPAAGVELVAAPPTLQPTTTPAAPALLTVSVVVAYDENGNRAVDPAEGVAGISVRVVEVGTNRVISQAFTDAQGFAQLQVVTSAPARVVVPYFGRVWEVPRSRGGGQVAFTLLLQPGNQPGLIP